MNRAAGPLLLHVRSAVDGRALQRALLALALPLALGLISGRQEWLSAAVVPVAMLIALDRSQLAPLGVAAHACAIGAGFVVLAAASAHAALFVLATVLLGMASVLVTAGGSVLRSLGSFTFIPALYLACESAQNHGNSLDTLPFLLISASPVLLLAAVEHWRSRDIGHSALTHLSRWTKPLASSERSVYMGQMITVAFAVAGSAALVEWRHIDHGQWLIWSAVSVVTGNASSARQKFHDRLMGAIGGVVVGIAAGLVMPNLPLVRVLIVFTTMLTLVCIRPYRLAFGARCACAALALVLAGGQWISGGERLLNVAAGSTIGLICALAASYATCSGSRRSI